LQGVTFTETSGPETAFPLTIQDQSGEAVYYQQA